MNTQIKISSERVFMRNFARLFILSHLRFFVNSFFLLFFSFFCGTLNAGSVPCLNPDHPMRLPTEVNGKLMPREIGCWFPRAWEAEEADGYKPFIDAIGNSTAFDLIAVSSRLVQTESDSPEAVRFQEDAARYAWEKYGIRMLPDAEIRLARKAFHRMHPGKSLCRLRMAETEQKAGEAASVILNDSELRDHYTHNYAYELLSVKPVKVWSYEKDAAGLVVPESVQDVTAEAQFLTEAQPGWCQFVFSPENSKKDRFLCAAAAFEYLYPDVHSEEALTFERHIFETLREVQVGGCVKDEWGMLPCHEAVPEKDHFWYSDAMAVRYAEETGGRNLADDCFLMHIAQAGSEKEAQRQAAIDAFNRMNLRQLLRFETQLYEITKTQWGRSAMPATHPTWHAYPNVQEFRKNSLFWWRHPRDFAQTDEYAPFACRTGTSKREGRVWYNEFYANTVKPYIYEEWTCTAAGGRMNIHPFCCTPNNPMRTKENFGILPILDAGVAAARARTRLLSFAADAPLFSPVAVVFGHYGCMNWARPEYGNLTESLNICDFFAQHGFPADFIPSSEIQGTTLAGTPCWTLDADGFLRYGAQSYRVIVFYAVTDSDRADFEALSALNAQGKTRILTLPGHVSAEVIAAQCEPLLAELNTLGTQTPWLREAHLEGDTNQHTHPGMNAFSRRLDGTLVWTRASREEPVGSAIHLENEEVVSNDGTCKFTVSTDAQGVFACRFSKDGKLETLTASGLTRFTTPNETEIRVENLETPADVSLWRDAQGQWQGIFQAAENDVPEALQRLPVNWRFLKR